MTEDTKVYTLRGDRPVCEACGGTGDERRPGSSARAVCPECDGDGRVGVVAAPRSHVAPGNKFDKIAPSDPSDDRDC